ncbi:MAG: hypothetical protein HOY71_53950, partial [Nonomuraea sp.]|nr:hypothetical protein [Nonomuraea sp.]
NIHAGGVAWHGDLVYVADTDHGLRVFDTNHLLDLRTAQNDLGDPKLLGRRGGKFHAFGYRYLLPQVDCWQPVTKGARFSFAAIDRSTTPHTLVCGEYQETDPNGKQTARPFPIGNEDLSVQSRRLWSVTEFRNMRVIFGVNL